MSLILRRPKPTQRGYLSRAESRRAYLRSKPRFLNTISRIKLQPQTPPPVLNPLSRQGISPFDAFLNNSYSWLASYFGNDDKAETKDETPKKSLLEQVREAVDRTYAMKGKKRKTAVDDIVMDKDVKKIMGLEPREIAGVPEDELKNMPAPDIAEHDPGLVVDIDDLAEKVGANPFNFDDELFDEYNKGRAEEKEAQRIAETVRKAVKNGTATILPPPPETVHPEIADDYVMEKTLRSEVEKTGELDRNHPEYAFSAARTKYRGKNPDEPWLHIKHGMTGDIHTFTWLDRERLLRRMAEEVEEEAEERRKRAFDAMKAAEAQSRKRKIEGQKRENEDVKTTPFAFDDALFDEYKDEQIRKAERKKARRIAEAIQAAEMEEARKIYEARKIEEERMKAEEARLNKLDEWTRETYRRLGAANAAKTSADRLKRELETLKPPRKVRRHHVPRHYGMQIFTDRGPVLMRRQALLRQQARLRK